MRQTSLATATWTTKQMNNDQKILNQDEIDALINGMDAGAVKTEPEAPPPPGTVMSFDFMNQMRIVRGRMPTLEMINERFARHVPRQPVQPARAARPKSPSTRSR